MGCGLPFFVFKIEEGVCDHSGFSVGVGVFYGIGVGCSGHM